MHAGTLFPYPIVCRLHALDFLVRHANSIYILWYFSASSKSNIDRSSLGRWMLRRARISNSFQIRGGALLDGVAGISSPVIEDGDNIEQDVVSGTTAEASSNVTSATSAEALLHEPDDSVRALSRNVAFQFDIG